MDQEKIKKALEAISKSGITVAGDLVLEKSVEYEVNNVEDGGIGIQIIYDKDKPLIKPQSDNKDVIENNLKSAEKNQRENAKVPDSSGINNPETTNTSLKQQKLDNNTPESKLILFLNRDWFNECTTDAGLYTLSWRSKYVKALMKEFGTRIAQGWAGVGTRNKQNLIKGHVIGALKKAGVIKGRNTDIARKALSIGVPPTDNEVKAIAAYMGHPQGNDESTQNPYRDWTDEYVEKTL